MLYMPVNLTNRDAIVCNNIHIINNSETLNVESSIKQLNNTINSVVGLPVETLNSLEKVATTINNDPLFFTTIDNDIKDKRKTINGYIITNSQNY